MTVRVGMEASGHARWFERLLIELQFELWIGDAAEIRTKRVRKQKTDRQDAQLLLRLLLEDRFPADLGTGRGESRSAATAVASPPAGADAHARHEPVARGGAQRGATAQESVVAAGGSGELEGCRWPLGRADAGKTCSTYSTGSRRRSRN